MFNSRQKKSSKIQDHDDNRSQDSYASTLSNPSTPKHEHKKCNPKKSNILEYSSSDQDDWKTEFTKSVRKEDIEPYEEAQKTKTGFKQKYPKEVKNIKAGTVQVKLKDNSNSKFEDLCAICLDKYSNVRGHLGCGHKFCFECIEEWVKSSTRCPCCRENFKDYVKVTMNEKNVEKERKVIEVEERVLEFSELDWYICYECGNGDDEDVLLVCDICQFYCCHVYCDPSLNNFFPEGEWYCEKCKEILEINEEEVKRNQSKAPNKHKKESKKPKKKSRKYSIFQSSQEEQDDDHRPVTNRVTRSMSNVHENIGRRSKAYEIMNMRPNTTTNDFAVQMERVNNSTAINLRNLRRRRIR